MASDTIEAVLFDKDGTLMDFHLSWGPWAVKTIHALADSQAQADEAAATLGVDLVRARFHEDSLITAGSPDDIIDATLPVFPSKSREEVMAQMIVPNDQFTPRTVPGMRQACDTLIARGLKLGLVTNDFEEGGHAHLDMMGVRELFHPIIGFDSGYGAKPAPDGCLAAAKILNVDPRACVMVGDSLHDLHAGRDAGMRTVGVLTGVVGADVLAPHADVVLEDVTEIPDWISSLA